MAKAKSSSLRSELETKKDQITKDVKKAKDDLDKHEQRLTDVNMALDLLDKNSDLEKLLEIIVNLRIS